MMDFRMRSVMSESTWFGLEPLDVLPEEAVQGALSRVTAMPWRTHRVRTNLTVAESPRERAAD